MFRSADVPGPSTCTVSVLCIRNWSVLFPARDLPTVRVGHTDSVLAGWEAQARVA